MPYEVLEAPAERATHQPPHVRKKHTIPQRDPKVSIKHFFLCYWASEEIPHHPKCGYVNRHVAFMILTRWQEIWPERRWSLCTKEGEVIG